MESSFVPQVLGATQSAITAAFFGSITPLTVSDCPSRNCSWQPYQSLAVCHQYIDISDRIQYDYSCFYLAGVPCAASLANGLTVNLWPWPESIDESRLTVMNTSGTGNLLKLGNAGFGLVDSTKIYNAGPFLGTNQWVDYRCRTPEHSFNAECRQQLMKALAATECVLHWCINRHSAVKVSGILKESYNNSWWSHSTSDVVSLSFSRYREEDMHDAGDRFSYYRPKVKGVLVFWTRLTVKACLQNLEDTF